LIRKNVVEACSKAEVSAIKFNQGVWYLGHNSFDVVIENLTGNKEFPLAGAGKRKQSDCGSFK
jgi:hypothetical protein